MKKGIAIFLAAAVALLCPFCVSFAATDISDQKSTVTVSVPDNTVILTEQNLSDNREILYKIGKTADDMRTLFDNGYVFYAFTKDEKYILSLSVTKSDLSAAAANMAELDDSQRTELIKAICGEAYNKALSAGELDEIEPNGAYFYRIVSYAQDSLPSIHYITVLNGYTVDLCLDSMLPELTENAASMIDTAFKSMKYTVVSSQSEKTENDARGVAAWFMWLVIILMAALGVWAIVSSASELHRRKMATNWQQKIRKKPRR